MKNLFDVSGKVAVVTGGSRGIGAMIARGLVENGVKTYITARKLDELKATAEALSTVGDCIALPSNLGSLEGVAAFAAAIRERESALHILVNNAGATWGAPIDEFPESGWDKVMDLNVKSLFFLTQALYNELKSAASADRPGKVINIASIDGIKINPWETYPYQASKAAVIHLTRRMAARLIKDNICVSAIAPGAFPSDMNRAARDAGDAVSQMIPAKRIGRDEDMAGTAVFLASKAGDYVVGDTLAVDGGVAYCSITEAWA